MIYARTVVSPDNRARVDAAIVGNLGFKMSRCRGIWCMYLDRGR